MLRELNQYVALRLKEIEPEYEELNTFSYAKLDVYRDAFQEFIQNFHTYRYFLGDIKREYDTAIAQLCDQLKSTSALRIELASNELKHVQEIQALEASHRKQLQIIADERSRYEQSLVQKDKEFRLKEEEIIRLNNFTRKARSEQDELRNSCMTLTNSLVRQEEERKVLAANEVKKSLELVNLSNIAQKSLEDVER